jgi:glycosyltransferase involved in cell wall biosynthesis
MTDVEQVVVVVPAHNELEHLPNCLCALTTAALCLPAPVLIVVVLDACDDGSERLAGEFGPDVHFVSVDAGNVGAARAAGFEYARDRCAAGAAAHTWYATTDADSTVNAQWLLRMTSVDADVVLGIVRTPCGGTLLPRWPAGICTHITRKDRATTTFTVQTWASAPTLTGVWGASEHCPPARTSSWSSDSRPPACASTATRSCPWQRRIVAAAARREASRSTCGT